MVSEIKDKKSTYKQVNKPIAICSSVKGVGKTWLSINLAHCLAAMRCKVLLFDADCGLENASYQLDLSRTQPYSSLFNSSVCLNNTVQRFDGGRFDIISSPAGENLLSSAPIGRIQILAQDLSHLSKYYDFVFIDCADDGQKNINSFINLCGTVILLVNPDPTSLIFAYKKLEFLKKINPMAKIKVVINRVLSHNEGQQTFKNILQAANRYIEASPKLLGSIRFDTRIREAVINKNLLLSRYPTCEASEDIVWLGRCLMENL